MFTNKTLERLEQMLDAAMTGEFQESDYDETRLSRLESKWKQFLGNSQLSKQNLEKEKQNIQNLVTDISHQTKTPITNIKLYTSLLQENLQGLEGQEDNLKMFAQIQRQTEKLEFLIQGLTKISRLETEMVALAPKSQSVEALIKEAIDSTSPKAHKKNIQIYAPKQMSENACYDLKWTKEALENILDNAIKYSDTGSEVKISINEYEMYTAVSVKDYGRGIAEEEIPFLFGRFYRSQQVQQEEGVGIGLYLAREIVKKENGYIKVHSELGKGSEFIIYLWRGRC